MEQTTAPDATENKYIQKEKQKKTETQNGGRRRENKNQRQRLRETDREKKNYGFEDGYILHIIIITTRFDLAIAGESQQRRRQW